MKTLEFVFATYKGTEYSSVMVEVDEEKRNVTATYEKRSLFKKERLQLTSFSYDEKTAVAAGETELTIGDLSLHSQGAFEVSELASMLHRPAVELAERNGKLYDELLPPLNEFVSARGAALDALKGVRDSPREAFVALWAQASPQDENVLGTLLTEMYKPVEVKKAALASALQTREKELGAAKAQSLYALIFILSRLQDSLFAADEAQAKEAYELADKMGLSQEIKPADWQQLKMGDISAKLLVEVSPKLKERIVTIE
jgi:hypothetical protein